MISELSAALTSANSISSIISTAISTKNLSDLHEVQIRNSDVIGQLIAAQTALSKVESEKRELERRLLELENKLKDFERYELHEMATGVFAYRLREARKNGEPLHYICPRCRSEEKKSILQRFDGAVTVTHSCPERKTGYLERTKPMPPTPEREDSHLMLISPPCRWRGGCAYLFLLPWQTNPGALAE